MSKIPEGHALIRLRDDNHADVAHLIAPFDRGFTLPSDHEVVKHFMDDAYPKVTEATVHGTDEFLWRLESWVITPDEFWVSFVPWVDGFRRVTVSDAAYLDLASRAA